MSVRVNIPIKLRVDPEALIDRHADIEEALAAAVGRALTNSWDVVLKPRGGYVGVRLHSPEFIWRGDGLHRVDGPIINQTESWINIALVEVTKSLNVGDSQTNNIPINPLIEEAVALIDDSNYSAVLGIYAIPSYDLAGSATAIPVENPPITTTQSTGYDYATIWYNIRSEADYYHALDLSLASAGSQILDHGYFGSIYRDRGRIWITVRHYPEDNVVLDGNVAVISYELRGRGRATHFVEVPAVLSPEARYHLRWLGLADSRDSRLTIFREFYGDNLRQFLRDNAELIPATINTEEFEHLLDVRVESILASRVDALLPGMRCFLELSVDGQKYLIKSGVDIPTDLESDLLPLIDFRRVRAGSIPPRPIQVRIGGDGSGDTPEGNNSAGDDRTPGENAGEASTGTHEGTGLGDAAHPGGFIYTGSTDAAEGSQLFPSLQRTSAALVCDSFMGEPSVGQLGDAGAALQRLIDEIASKLQMSACEYAGKFCINAAAILQSRTMAVGAYAVRDVGATRRVEANTGNLGLLEFGPTASPAIQFMRHLAAVVPLITELSHRIDKLYTRPGVIQGEWSYNPIGWLLRFHIELTAGMNQAVGLIFAMTCRALLLQLMYTSYNAIQSRITNFPTYAPIFEQLVMTQLADIVELIPLRDRLQRFQREIQARETLQRVDAATPHLPLELQLPVMEWSAAAHAVTDALISHELSIDHNPVTEGEIVQSGGVARIRDRHNRLWTLNDLESAIATRRGLAEDIDPLVKQLTDIPDLMQRFRANPAGIHQELRRLLNEMCDNNVRITAKVLASWEYAVEASKIQGNIPSASVPGTSFVLQGIHLQAHQQIGEFFREDPYYASGINALFNAQLGFESLKNFFEFTGIILISVICPPLGAVIGILDAAHQRDNALEREQLYSALIDPELVLSRAEVEADLFAAKLGLVLSFVPEVGSILRVGRYGVRATLRAGVSGGARIVGRYVARRITREMVEALSRNLILVFAREVITNEVMEQVISRTMEPYLQYLERETTITGPVGGSQGADIVRRMLEEERTRRK